MVRTAIDLRRPETLAQALAHPNPYFRAEILGQLRDVFAAGDRLGNFPFGARSSIGVLAGREALYAAVAPHATAALFALFLDYPLATDDYEPRQKILAELGKSLVQHPDAAAVLLRAYDAESDSRGQVRFAQAVFKAAGPALLPVLHEALASPDRVVRSNAARACGAIGDSASGPLLLKALDLESGLSRASIVWALGELKCRDALPRLAEIYTDAVTDASRRRGSGFLAAQNGAATQAQYRTLSQVDALSQDWNELKQAAKNGPVDPRQNEELLEPGHILEAIRRIGAKFAQPFYRSLAGAKDDDSRTEAASGLAAATGEERAASAPVLRNLLADANDGVRLRAAVSLLVLGEEPGPAVVCEWLTSGDRWKKQRAVSEMHQAGAKAQPRSVRTAIKAIAADPELREDTRKAAAALLQ